MKFLILALALVAAVAAAPQHEIVILRQAQDIAPDGSYSFAYETENGIVASENGAPGPLNENGEPAVVSNGQYQYTAPDGTPISVSYVANENGFQPQGAHIPQTPVLIQRALEWIATHPQRDLRPQDTFPRQNFPRPIA